MKLASIAALSCWIGSAPSQPLQPSTAFVAHIEKRFMKSPDDPKPTIVRVIYARRSDNSFAQIFDSKSPDGTQTKSTSEIFDAQKSHTIILEPFTKSAVIMRYSAREYQQTVASLESENCGPPSNGKSITKFGRKAIREVERLPLGATTNSRMEWTHERYVIPELRCFSIHTIDRRSDGATTEEEVISLKEGKPPASYFDVPPDYTERSPRELNDAYTRKFRQELWSEAAVKTMERRYRKK